MVEPVNEPGESVLRTATRTSHHAVFVNAVTKRFLNRPMIANGPAPKRRAARGGRRDENLGWRPMSCNQALGVLHVCDISSDAACWARRPLRFTCSASRDPDLHSRHLLARERGTRDRKGSPGGSGRLGRPGGARLPPRKKLAEPKLKT